MGLIKLFVRSALSGLALFIGVLLGIMLFPIAMPYYIMLERNKRPKCVMCTKKFKELDLSGLCETCGDSLDRFYATFDDEEQQQEQWAVLDIQYAERPTKRQLSVDIDMVEAYGVLVPFINNNRGNYIQVGNDGYSIM